MKAWQRQSTTALVAAALTWVFVVLHRSEASALPVQNLVSRSLADSALLLLVAALSLGPLARIIPRLAPMLPWRREVGLWSALLAFAHVAWYTGYGTGRWFDWSGLFPPLAASQVANRFTVADWVGLWALAFAVLLALTANNLAQRLFGSGWKFLQQQAYTCFALACAHTFLILYIGYNGLRTIPSALLTWGFVLVLALQAAGFAVSVRSERRRRAAERRDAPLPK